MDFTVADAVIDKLSFIDAILPDSNFEGVDLSPKEMHFKIFENKAYLKNLGASEQFKEMVDSGGWNILVISEEVRGNDLVLEFVFFNTFSNANLENTNFKNADLRNASFYLADLTNADLSGADLRKAYLSNADLSNANLDGANLSGANLSGANLSGVIYNSSTTLNCVGHPICVN